MIQAIIPLIARAASMAARAAPALSRAATTAARAAPVRSGMRAGLRGAAATLDSAQPALEGFEKLSGAVSSATHEMGALTGMVFDAGKAFFTLPARIRDFSSAIIDAQHTLATYNGTMAAANMRLQGQRFRRDLSLSLRTSGSYQRLTESQSSLEQTLLPYKAALQNLINTIGTGLNNAANIGVKVFEVLNPIAAYFVDKIGRERTADASSWAARVANDIARGEYSKRRMPVLGDPKGEGMAPRVERIFGAKE